MAVTSNFSEKFTRSFDRLMQLEGYKSNHKNDKGGLTVYGISQVYHPQMFESGPPTRETAKQFYWEAFWLPAGCESISSERVAFELFESSVNCGIGRGVMFLHKAMKALTRKDPGVNKDLVNAVNAFALTYENALVRAQNWFQGAHYFGLDVRNLNVEPRSQDFIKGWIGKRLD